MTLAKNEHLRWRRWPWNQNVGYIRFKTVKGMRIFWDNWAAQQHKSEERMRIWHTKRLIIIWEDKKP